MSSMQPPATGPRKGRRLPLAKPGDDTGFVLSTSRPLYTSRTRRGPLLVPNEKAAGLLPCESVLESTFVAATRFDTRIAQVVPQPRVMDVVSGLTGRNREQLMDRLASEGYSSSKAVLWFVDFELEIVNCVRPIYVEVKPAKRAGDVAERLEARARACERIGVGFMLVLDKDFGEPLAANLRILQRYAGMPVSEVTKARVLDAVGQRPIRLSDLAEAACVGLAELYGLVSSGDLGLDLRAERLSPRSTVHAGNPEHRIILDLPQ